MTMTDLNVKQEYLRLTYGDSQKVDSGKKVGKLLSAPLTQYLIFLVVLGAFPLLAQLGVLTSSFVFAIGNTMIYEQGAACDTSKMQYGEGALQNSQKEGFLFSIRTIRIWQRR